MSDCSLEENSICPKLLEMWSNRLSVAAQPKEFADSIRRVSTRKRAENPVLSLHTHITKRGHYGKQGNLLLRLFVVDKKPLRVSDSEKFAQKTGRTERLVFSRKGIKPNLADSRENSEKQK